MLTLYRSSTERLRHWRDALRRLFVRGLLDRPLRERKDSASQVVFVRWDGKLGDTIVLSWVYRELMRARPDLRLTVLTHAALADMHRDGFGLDHVIVCSKRPGFLEILRLARQVRHARYVIHLTESFKPRDFLFVRCVAPAQVVSLDDSALCVNVKLGQSTNHLHFSQKLLPWFESLGIRAPDTTYRVPGASSVDTGEQGLHSETRITGFCPVGAGGKRKMSDRTVIELVQIMRRVSGHRILLLVAADQIERMRRIIETLADNHVFLPDNPHSLNDLFANVRRCDYVVSVDTATVHVATGLDKPQLALYNPDSLHHQNYPKWHPNSSKAQTLFAERVEPQHIDAVDRQKFRQAYERLVLPRSEP